MAKKKPWHFGIKIQSLEANLQPDLRLMYIVLLLLLKQYSGLDLHPRLFLPKCRQLHDDVNVRQRHGCSGLRPGTE